MQALKQALTTQYLCLALDAHTPSRDINMLLWDPSADIQESLLSVQTPGMEPGAPGRPC